MTVEDKRPLEQHLVELKMRLEKQTKMLDALDEKYLTGELDVTNYNRLSGKLQKELDEINECRRTPLP